mmetsp:Transcript_16127/g.48784  ORF Transcript_16127/g.48784 Transcript_16127/m.48784 type:complete len:504 (-) Transcript_16127:103-1614(-)
MAEEAKDSPRYSAPRHRGASLWSAAQPSAAWRAKIPEDVEYDKDLDDFLNDDFVFPNPNLNYPARLDADLPKPKKEEPRKPPPAKKPPEKKNFPAFTQQEKTEPPKPSKSATPKELREQASKERVDQKWQRNKAPDACMAWNCSKKRQFRCSACQERWYCSRSCQKSDWTNCHKLACPKLKAAKEKRDNYVKPETIKIHLRKQAKGSALDRQNKAIKELTFSDSVDYVVFAENSTVETEYIKLPNMGSKVQARILRLKAAQGHYCYLKMLHKLLVDNAPHLTTRIRHQMRSEYDIDPMSPMVQESKDDNPYDFPTDYENSRVFASLGIGSVEDLLTKAGYQESMDQAKREYAGQSFEDWVAENVPEQHDPYQWPVFTKNADGSIDCLSESNKHLKKQQKTEANAKEEDDDDLGDDGLGGHEERKGDDVDPHDFHTRLVNALAAAPPKTDDPPRPRPYTYDGRDLKDSDMGLSAEQVHLVSVWDDDPADETTSSALPAAPPSLA